MTKNEALNLLGGTVESAARAIGITASAVSQWPDELPQRVADRVQAALWRKAQGVTVRETAEALDGKRA